MSVLQEISQLIAQPSVSSVRPEFDMSNRSVTDLLANWLEDAGFEVELLPIDHGASPKANLIATRGRGPGGLVLSGHTDTVPYDEGKWQSDPFVATEREGKLYGLGTTDMKAFLALAVEAARRTNDLPQRRPLTILATADEECGMAGARALVAAGKPSGSAAVIGEPTNMKPIRMHKGASMEYVRLIGRSGHSSDPALGASALEGMRRVLNAMDALRVDYQRRFVRPDLHPPHMTMNLGNIHGGDNPNRICAECELQFDIRVLPGMDTDEVRRELHGEMKKAIEGLGLELRAGALHSAVPPFETAATAAIVRAAESLTGYSSEGVSFCTEGPFFNQMGIPTIVLGPGDIGTAHQPNEYLSLNQIDPCIELLTKLIGSFCVADEVPTWAT